MNNKVRVYKKPKLKELGKIIDITKDNPKGDRTTDASQELDFASEL